MKWKSRSLITIIVIIGLCSITSVVDAASNGKAIAGEFKISHFTKDQLIKLNGEWEFYWQKLYTPRDFIQKDIAKNRQFVTVPQEWTSYNFQGNHLPLAGYATYRLRVQLPQNALGTVKAIYMPSEASAYHLWINGKEMSKVGTVATNRKEMIPDNNPKVIMFKVDSNPIELIVQISNFHQRRAGLEEGILIGEPEPVMAYKEKSIIYRTIIIISIVIIGLYHAALFLFRKKEYSFLFFAIVCIVVAVRATIQEEGLASYLLSFLSWEIACKLEYLGATLGTLFIALFSYTQFPQEMNRKLRNIITIVWTVNSLFIIVTPAVIYTRAMLLIQILMIITFLYIIYVYYVAVRAKREGSYLNTAAIIVMFAAILNDTFYFNRLIATTELASVALFFFLFTQAIILSKKYATSFAKTERLSEDLSRMNASLEQQVLERTQELKQANEELFITNQKLYEVQQSKNKWIRNISHEIAAPLTNIRSYTKGMLDGVIPPEQKYIQLIYDQSLYFSRMLHDLNDISEIENHQIKFTLEQTDIREYFRSLYEKYKWDIEKQGIKFIMIDNLPPQTQYIFIDTTRIEQVIVNLLKNAQRFVKEDGKISLELAQENTNEVTIKVRDNGIGIKGEEVGLVFNRFFKNSTKGKPHSGAGLGLAIAKEIIEYHKGTIAVESKPGKGSCFYFNVPIMKTAIETQFEGA